MPSQTGTNLVVAYKVESVFNTAPGATGGTEVRFNPSPGLKLSRALITPNEIRRDQQSPMARLGSASVAGSYGSDMSVGTHDDWYEAALRGTWVADVAITNVEMTSITTTATTIVAAAGSWITEGVRVGDIVVLTGHSTAGNNDLNLRVKAVVALTITLHGTAPLTADATPDSAFTLTIKRKVIQAAGTIADPLVRRTFYIDESFTDIDESSVFGGCKIGGFNLGGGADGMATVEFPIVGASFSQLTGASAPYYTTPTRTTTIGLVLTDASISVKGVDIAVATDLQIAYTINPSTLPVIGASVTPDVFDNVAELTGTVSMLRQDLNHIADMDAETEFEIHALLEEPEVAPKDQIALFLPKLKFTDVDAALGQDGAMVETLQFVAGKKESVTGYDDGMITISTSAA